MANDPLCPSCGRKMPLSRTLVPDVGETIDVNVFKCKVCGVAFISEDHLPIAGVRVRGN
jgi:predicted amidophosphoribosyltransferase